MKVHKVNDEVVTEGSRPQQQPQLNKKFVGKEDNLGDEYVYEYTVGREASDQYISTTEEIVRYWSTKLKNGGDVERSLSSGTRLVIALVTAPVGVGTAAPVDTEVMVYGSWRSH
jgi:hypothetical protein